MTSVSGSGFVQVGGNFSFIGGEISGELVLLNVEITVADTVIDPATIEVRGAYNTLVDNASSYVTLLVRGTDWDHDAVLAIEGGATNAGTILLSSIGANPWNSGLSVTDPVFTNLATGVIESEAGTGGSRWLNGYFLNQGEMIVGTNLQLTGELHNQGSLGISSGKQLAISGGPNGSVFSQEDGTVTLNGNLWIDGGAVTLSGGAFSGSGGFAAKNVRVNTTSGMSSTVSMDLFGSGNVLENAASTDVTLRLRGSDVHHESVLAMEFGATNAGTIVLESDSGSWGQSIVSRSTFSSLGTIAVNAGSGGRSAYYGNLQNDGTVSIASGASLQMSAVNDVDPTFVQNGTVNASGSFVQNGGLFDFQDGSVAGSNFFANGTDINVAAGVTTASTINVVTPGSTLLANLSPSYVSLDWDDDYPPGHENGPGYIHVSVSSHQILSGGTVTYFVEFDLPTPPLGGWGATAPVVLDFGDCGTYSYSTSSGKGSFSATHTFWPVAVGTKYWAFGAEYWTDPDTFSAYVPITIVAGPANGGPATSSAQPALICPVGPMAFNSGTVPNTSPHPVRYFDGVLNYQAVDLESSGFGTTWMQSRSWTNAANYDGDGLNGVGTIDTQMLHLVQEAGGGITIVQSGMTSFTFDRVPGGYQTTLWKQGNFGLRSGSWPIHLA